MGSEEENKKWHYLKVNKGRYLCLKHGGFCDVADNHAQTCPLCDEDVKGNEKNWEINHVDTALQIVRNLQARSMNRFYLIYGITGFLGVLSVFQKFDLVNYLSNLCWLSKVDLILFCVCFFASFICYLISMSHVKVTCRNYKNSIFGTAKFLEKTITGWEAYMVDRVNKFEFSHKAGNWLLCFSVGFLILFLFIEFILPLIYK